MYNYISFKNECKEGKSKDKWNKNVTICCWQDIYLKQNNHTQKRQNIIEKYIPGKG